MNTSFSSIFYIFAPKNGQMDRKVIIKKVNNKRLLNDFIRLPRRLYANCPQYVPDLDSDIR